MIDISSAGISKYYDTNLFNMETFGSRLKKGGIKEANWQALYILSRHWRSDLEFYIKDLQFLQCLINRYSIWIKKTQNSVTVGKLISNLHQLSSNGKSILEHLQDHLRQLSSLMDGDKDLDPEIYIRDHEELEDEITHFVKSFRNSRKEVFRVTKELMDSEDLFEHSPE